MRQMSSSPKKTRKAPSARERWHQIRNGGLALVAAFVPLFFIGVLAIARAHDWDRWLGQFDPSTPGSRPATSRGDAAVKHCGNGRADFGQVAVESYDPAGGITTRTVFHMSGQTAFRDQRSFHTFAQQYGHTIREQAMVTVRTSRLAEVFDTEFLARKIRARVNRILGQTAIETLSVDKLEVLERSGPGTYTRLSSDLEPAPPPAEMSPAASPQVPSEATAEDTWRP